MAAVDLDRQRIERRDFPVSRRGYDPAAVDAHLRDLADNVERERERARRPRGTPDSVCRNSAMSEMPLTIVAAVMPCSSL